MFAGLRALSGYQRNRYPPLDIYPDSALSFIYQEKLYAKHEPL